MFVAFDMCSAFVIGMGLGLIYFGGLWLTVQHLPQAGSPGLLALGSFWTRMGVCLLGFYTAMHGQSERLLICLLGFVCVRSIVVQVVPRVRWLAVQRST